jgi:hypothetical protein
MNWKNEVNKMNAAAYSWPKGWSSREEIAEQLECSPERVREVLSPGLKAGTIETKEFKVWDGVRLLRRPGYRKVEKGEAPAPTAASVPKAGMAVISRKRGSRGRILEVRGDKKMVIDWETAGRKECSLSALKRGDIRLV